MNYDNWKCGGSDPGYDPMDPRDEPEPETGEELETILACSNINKEVWFEVQYSRAGENDWSSSNQTADAVRAINNLKGKVIKRKAALVGVEKYDPNEPCPRCGSTSKAWDGLIEPPKWVCGRCRYAFWDELRHCDEVKK